MFRISIVVNNFNIDFLTLYALYEERNRIYQVNIYL